jgi:hypothetical protein
MPIITSQQYKYILKTCPCLSEKVKIFGTFCVIQNVIILELEYMYITDHFKWHGNYGILL